MGAAERHIQTRISAYLTSKVKEAFLQDFSLIESRLPDWIQQHSLKELIIVVRLEIDRIKTGNRDSSSQALKNPRVA